MTSPGAGSVEHSLISASGADRRHRFACRAEDRYRDLAGDGNSFLSAIDAEIESRLSDPDFSLAALSSSLNVSTRQVQRAMAGIGTTFSACVRNKRLALAMEQLRQDDMKSSSIECISLACGFGDLSTFYRAFKARYGCTPGDIRNEVGSPPDRKTTPAATQSAVPVHGDCPAR